ncbi:TPA: hypothetical protein ACF637_004771, partial [Salmonella enterica]|nr:hypothetical protein [Salmonella enterica subsp. enterica serovar Kottbus]EGP4122364.1 hypothetical protein [Salmonella enterica]EBR8658595.1 hypothetical protein [Salmonella enterica subsp. enterica serovar Kottbus]EBU7432815.1 hypothetical protein [Salmonella enterica subsp. enterica serovar Kottbus]EBV3501003.1 hypothetical protein [Salmonella enterica subsp. enterica serovar Kottbus]
SSGNTSLQSNVVVPFRPEFDDYSVSFEYFENNLLDNAIGKVTATDKDGDVVNYFFVHNNGSQHATSQDGKYAVNKNGEIFLTVSGGGLESTNSSSIVDSNDFETQPNKFGPYKIIAVDNSGLKSDDVIIDFTVNNIIALPYLYYQTVNDINGVDSSGEGFSKDTLDSKYQFSSNTDDKFLIGYTESGYFTTGLGLGNIERGAVLSTLGGDDYVKLSQSVGSNNMDGGVDLGDGNNTILIGNDIIGGSKRSWVISNDGNDIITVGDFSSIVNDRDDIQNATVITGAGDDILTLQGGDVKDNSLIDMGSGNDTVILKDSGQTLAANQRLDGNKFNSGLLSGGNLQSGSVIILGEGNDNVTIERYFGNATIIGGIADKEVLKTGTKNYEMDSSARNLKDNGIDDGIDTVVIGGAMTDGAKIYLGEGDDVMTIGTKNGYSGNVDGSNTIIDMGGGNDRLTIKGNIQNAAKIDMGDGNNSVIVEGGVNNTSSITFGSGDDQLTIGTTLGEGLGNPIISLGAGNDIVTWGGTTISSTNKIDGGIGIDTLILTTLTDTKTNSDVTNLSSQKFTSFENIEMISNGQSVDIRYKDLLDDTENEIPLHIKGVKDSVVDLGQNNWTSDALSNKQNLSDNSQTLGKWTKQNTITEDGITYDIYHHSAAGNSSVDDVYIQQGIIVI